MCNDILSYVVVALSWAKFDSDYVSKPYQKYLEQQFSIIRYFNSLVIPYCVRKDGSYDAGSTIILDAFLKNDIETLLVRKGIPSVSVFNYIVNDKQKSYCNYYKDSILYSQKKLDIFLMILKKYNNFMTYMNFEDEDSEKDYPAGFGAMDFFEFFRLINKDLDLAIKLGMCTYNDTSESNVCPLIISDMIDYYLDLAIELGLRNKMIDESY